MERGKIENMDLVGGILRIKKPVELINTHISNTTIYICAPQEGGVIYISGDDNSTVDWCDIIFEEDDKY